MKRLSRYLAGVGTALLILAACAQLGIQNAPTIAEVCTPVGATEAETRRCSLNVRIDYLAANADAILTWANTMAQRSRLPKATVLKFIEAGDKIALALEAAEVALDVNDLTTVQSKLAVVSQILVVLATERGKYGDL